MPFNLATISEAIAAAIPERECIIFRDRRLTWNDVNRRSRRLANFLMSQGLGAIRSERPTLANHQSGQDHLGLYLYNGNEYLEGMLGSYKARVAPFNVNYRYIEDELVYLLTDADCRALIYHASFAPRVAKIRDRLPQLTLLLQVADDSGTPLLDGAFDYETALAGSSEDLARSDCSGDDLYILYTGGTTGMPKGVLWRQEDIFFGALGGHPIGGSKFTGIDQVAEMAKSGSMRAMAAPPFMHGAAHWMAFTCLHQGGTVIVQDQPTHLDPHDIWSTIERERVAFLTIVGDAFGQPLLDQLSKHDYDLSQFRTILSGGAILTASLKQALLEALPHIMIIDGFGASETGGQGTQVHVRGAKPTTGTFRMNEQTTVLKDDLSGPLEPGSPESGWLARSGHVPLGYYKDADKTARTFPVLGGIRWAVPGDHAILTADGTINVLGRGSVSINSGGEKIYPEEVEQALKHHPSVYDAVVVGTPSDRFGEQVTALVRLRPGTTIPEQELIESCAAHLSRYKLPRVVLFVDHMERSPSGKADYRWAKRTATERLSRS